MSKTINGCHVSLAKQKLLSMLGDPWTVRQIDFEPCVYRDLGLYDIEISGGRTGNAALFIYVWEKRPDFFVIEQHRNLHYGTDDIKDICDDIVDRLGVETSQTYTEIVMDGFRKMALNKEDFRRIRDLSNSCNEYDRKVDSIILSCLLESGIKVKDRWWEERDIPVWEINAMIEAYRDEHPEDYMGTEEWNGFREREEEYKKFIKSLSARKTQDLLCVVRLGKYLECSPISIKCACVFRDSVQNGYERVVELDICKVLAEPHKEKLSMYISLAGGRII